MSKRKFCLLVNPYAGNSTTVKVLKKVENALKDLCLDYRTVITTDATHAESIAKEASIQGEYVAVLGGDGSVGAIAETVMKYNGILALLPSGRGNDFARMMKYPINPILACKVLSQGEEKSIDVGKINERIFLTICSMGFDSVVNNVANRSTLVKGKIVYLYAGIRVMATWKPITFLVNIDGDEFEHIGYTVAIANTQYYGGGLRIAPTACAQDGLLDIALIGDIPKHKLIMNIPNLYRGTHINVPGFKLLRGRNVTVKANPQYTVVADGDFICPPPSEISVVPNALRILLPSSEKIS